MPSVVCTPMTNDLAHTLTDAYEHLYDIAHLRAKGAGLAALVGVAATDSPWRVHQALITLIDTLNPNLRAPVMSREWRRHRLMKLRYVDGLQPQEVADALAVSRRQYYRVHDEAIDALTHLLHLTAATDDTAQPEPKPTSASNVIESALMLLHDRLRHRRVRVDLSCMPQLPPLHVNEKLFRQLLLGAMDFLIERAQPGTLWIEIAHGNAQTCFRMTLNPGLPAGAQRDCEFDVLASLSNATVIPLLSDQTLTGFEIRLPADDRISARHLLIVDDNEDTRMLCQRLLAQTGVVVTTAGDSAQMFEAIARSRPDLIILDLMLPGNDGWDTLQLLRNEPESREIPVFICSVLKQAELALALGAAGFIEKPFSRETLLSAIKRVEAVQ
jgi:CheY-like chemotaxis protein